MLKFGSDLKVSDWPLSEKDLGLAGGMAQVCPVSEDDRMAAANADLWKQEHQLLIQSSVTEEGISIYTLAVFVGNGGSLTGANIKRQFKLPMILMFQPHPNGWILLLCLGRYRLCE